MSAGIAATVLGAAPAEAQTYKTQGIKLTHSQTVLVAQNGLGNAFSAIPYIPNLVYNPYWGRGIQKAADTASRNGGCIAIGIGTPSNGKGGNVNYVTTYPKKSCAR